MKEFFRPGDRVRFRGQPGLGIGTFVRYTAHDAFSGRPFKCLCRLTGLDAGETYEYEDHFSVADLLFHAREEGRAL